jgi:hypothetical protein
VWVHFKFSSFPVEPKHVSGLSGEEFSILYFNYGMGEDRGVHRVLEGRPEGKRQLGRPRRRWEDNIKMDLQEVGGGHWDWMELVQDTDRLRALVGTVKDIRVPKMRGIS